ncbi:MAG: aryl-sulfate sulfotransferase, partial [Fibrobacterota bacterium]
MLRLTKKYGALFVSLLVTGFFISANAFSDGYILSEAWAGKTTMLYDNKLNVVTTWDHSKLPDSLNGYSCYLMPNGHLLRSVQTPPVFRGSTQISPPANAAPQQGTIDEIDAKGNVVWSYTLCDSIHMLHHDFKLLSNGNILAVSFVRYSRAQMIAAGVDSTIKEMNGGIAKSMLGEKIVEIKPDHENGGGSIVWEWTMFDHVAPKEKALNNPNLISGSIVKALFSGQWVHLNGLDYDSTRDLITFTSRVFSELYVIDHSTTTEEAKSHSGGRHGKGGDILYRWGHTSNYLENGTQTIRVLHCPTWIPKGYPGEGNIMFFHNNLKGASGASEVVEITPPFDNEGKFIQPTATGFGPESPTWLYAPTSNFRSDYMSSTFRLPDGNTLIHEAYPGTGVGGSGSRLREITKELTIVDTGSLKANASTGTAYNPAKVMFYPPSYIGIQKLLAALNTSSKTPQYSSRQSIQVLPNGDNILFVNAKGYTVGIFALNGKPVMTSRASTDRVTLSTGNITPGTYLLKIINGKSTVQHKLFTN